MSAVYDKILAQSGMSEFKELIQKWQSLSENMKKKPTGVPIILPDIFLVSHSGTGRTHLLQLLSEFLSETPNLMDFYGDVQFFEFMLNYCAPNAHFSEIQRFMTEIGNAAGFRSEYRGIVYIDVDEWREHFEEKHFTDFLEYLSDNSNEWLVVFSVTDVDENAIAPMETLISAFLRIEKVTLERPTVEELLAYGERLLSSYGIRLSKASASILKESISVICQNRYFDGYKTIKMFFQDIAYTVYVSGEGTTKALSPTFIERFAKDSEYVHRIIAKFQKAKKIGFC